jgi:hypothetical protein
MLDDSEGFWRVFIEARDAVRAVLAPGLRLRHLLGRGEDIGRRLIARRPRRAKQMSGLPRIFRKPLG